MADPNTKIFGITQYIIATHKNILYREKNISFITKTYFTLQVEKGPVDQCTHDARYSLSEDRLLREAVAAGVVRCCVVQDELEEDVVVRVLDCDSISQVRTQSRARENFYYFYGESFIPQLAECKDVN